MKIDFLPEPELEFGNGGRHIDIRFGMMHHKPLDYDISSAPNEIQLGVVGGYETVEGLETWLDKCKQGIGPKNSKQPHLFPEFPGFGEIDSLPTNISMDSRRNSAIPRKDIEKLLKNGDHNTLVQETVRALIEELKYIDEKTSPDVLICALPQSLLERMNTELEKKGSRQSPKMTKFTLDFHDLFKAKAMALRKPTQIILPATINLSKKSKVTKQSRKPQTLQDEATRAWNFYTALYYKSLGTPWRLIRNPRDLATCYMGISFYKTLDRSKLLMRVNPRLCRGTHKV